jgi:hypothetical protein
VTHSGNVWERLLQARDRPHSLLRSSPLFCIGILAISKRGGGNVASRIWYAATRTLVTRQDSGRSNINASFLGGFAMSVALSNSYYPDRNRNASDAAARYGEGVAINAVFNVVREFVIKPH